MWYLQNVRKLKLQMSFEIEKRIWKQNKQIFGKKERRKHLLCLGRNSTPLSSLLSLRSPKWPNTAQQQPNPQPTSAQKIPRGVLAKLPSSSFPRCCSVAAARPPDAPSRKDPRRRPRRP
jgi:hypothetical protein